jgi:hypothetical protein
VHRWRGEIYRYTGDHLRHYTNPDIAGADPTGRPRTSTAPACRARSRHGGQEGTRRKGRRSSASVAGLNPHRATTCGTTRTQISPARDPNCPLKDTVTAGVPHGRSWRKRGRAKRRMVGSASVVGATSVTYGRQTGTTRTQISPARGTPSGVPEGHRLRRRTHGPPWSRSGRRGESLFAKQTTLGSKARCEQWLRKKESL